MTSATYVHEYKAPPSGYAKVGRYIYYVAKFSVRPGAKTAGSGPAVSLKPGETKVGFDHYLGTTATKFKQLGFNDFTEALKQRSVKPILKKLGLEHTVKVSEGLSLGAELDLCPFIIKYECPAGQFRGFTGKVVVQFNIGLTPEGWTQLAKRMGPKALSNALRSYGATATLQSITAKGALAAGALVVATLATSFGILAATAAYAGYQSKLGEDKGIATWYAAGYARTLLQTGLRAPDHYDPKVKKEQADYLEWGKSAARQDAMRHVARFNIALDNPADWKEILAIFSYALGEKFGSLEPVDGPGYRALRDYITDQAYQKIQAGEL